jgi:hypothetical protein
LDPSIDRNIRIVRQIGTGLKPYRMLFKEFKRKRKKKKKKKKEKRKKERKKEKRKKKKNKKKKEEVKATMLL